MPRHDYRTHFPFPTIRPQQVEAIEFTLNAFESGKKYVVLEMGTGCGKSAVGVCISRYLQRSLTYMSDFAMQDVSVRGSVGSWFLTTQKILQEQYVRDFGRNTKQAPGIRSIKSSTSYNCQLQVTEDDDSKISCGEVHRLMSANAIFKMLYAPCMDRCCYKEDKKRFLEALESVTNYSYFFTESQYAKQIQGRELLVLDEAHTIEGQLGGFVEVTISERFAKDALNVKMPKTFKDIKAAVRWVKNKYMPALRDEVIRMGKMLEEMGDAAKKVTSFKDYAQRHDMLDKHMCKVGRMLKVFIEDNWIMNLIPAEGRKLRKIQFKPVDVSTFALDHLFAFADKVLMMSATILDKGVFCRSLGLDELDVAFLRIGSPFDVKNRPIHVMPVGSMAKAAIEKTLPKMAEAVEFILEQHDGEKGIIHCVNFRVANYIVENVANNRLVTHTSQNREQILRLHEESDVPSVLVSPSMMEGVDLAGDKSRFQIICKVPFPFLGDDVVKKRMAKDKIWYDYRTVMMVVQALGRSIRHENDHAVSYVLDADWGRFYHRSRRMFPDEILKAIQ